MTTYNAKTTGSELAENFKKHIQGRTVLVTGVSAGGLGAAFVETIAIHSPKLLILAGRSAAKAEETAKAAAATAPGVSTRVLVLDLSSQKQARTAAAEVLAYDEPIDVLVNNAGIMAVPYATTEDGLETQFGANHIGHFLFTMLIMPKILAAGPGARIVNVSSAGHRLGWIRFDDFGFDGGKTYNRWAAYGQSKSANMLFSVELAKRLGPKGVTAVSLHPGVIWTKLAANANLEREFFSDLIQTDKGMGNLEGWRKDASFKSMDEGTATHVFAAFAPEVEKHNGAYLADSQVQEPENVKCWARDSVEAARLWKLSEDLVGQKFAWVQPAL